MRKRRIWVFVLFGLLAASGVHAHLTGAFADFLVTVEDEATTGKLTEEMRKTKQDIEDLQPRIAVMEHEFGEKQQEAVTKLRFYSELGLDTWLNLMLQSEDFVDILGNQRLLERHLDTYLGELEQLYGDYSRLLTTKETLEGHGRLLAVIEDNVEARARFISQNPGIPLEQLANYLDIDWSTEVEDKLIASLASDQVVIDQKLQMWAARMSDGAPYTLNESWLNEQSGLDYYFRTDHIYAVYQKPDLHVILLGQMLKDGEESASLQFEAGFFNGFLMPETLLTELHGFRIPYSKLRSLPEAPGSFYLQQAAGTLIMKSNE